MTHPALQLSNLDPLHLNEGVVELGVVLTDKVGGQFKGRSGVEVDIKVFVDGNKIDTYTVKTGVKGKASLTINVEAGRVTGTVSEPSEVDVQEAQTITAFAYCLEPPMMSNTVTVALS